MYPLLHAGLGRDHPGQPVTMLKPGRRVIALSILFDIILMMNSKQRKALEALFSEPVNGNIEWARIESLFAALGCRLIEGAGSAVTFEHGGHKATFHRPHPGKEALRYRVRAAREFLAKIGVTA